MLVLWFRPQIETLDIIELRLSVMASVVIEHLTEGHDWISLLYLINTIPWLELISSIILFDLSSSILWSNLIKSYLFIRFNYFDSKISSLHLPMEGGEICSKPHPGEYYWSGSDLTQNTRGQYIPLLLVAVVILTPPEQKNIELFTTGYLF